MVLTVKLESIENEISEGDIDDEGNRMIINQKSNGKYHSNWLKMMYPRLKVAKDLLADDGMIFICIDDNEIANLRKICDESFGEENFIANIVWKHTKQSKNDEPHFSRQFNYIVVYASSSSNVNEFKLKRTEKDNVNYSNPDNDPKGDWRSGDVRSPNYRKTLCFDIISPSGKVIKAPEKGWRWSEETLKEKIETGEIVFKNDDSGIIRKIYLYKQNGRTPENLWDGEDFGTTRQANSEIKELFNSTIFDTPKPTKLIMKIMELIYGSNDYIFLDFFSGSASSAQAVMQINAEDEGKRKFIMVQTSDEQCTEKSEAYKLGYKNICEIGKERIRRAGEKIKKENKDKEGIESLDVGFKFFKVEDTNIRWFSEAIKSNVYDFDLTMTDKDKLDFNPGFTDIDVVYEILLRHRDIPLSTNVSPLSSIGKRTYIFADTVVVCLEESVTDSIIDQVAAIEPMPAKIIFRDSAFGEDISLKENTMMRLEAQIRKQSGQEKKAYRIEFL